MTKRCKVTAKKIFYGFALALLFLLTFQISAKNHKASYFFKSLTERADTSKPSADSLLKKNISDSLIKDTSAADTSLVKDSLHKKNFADTLYISKDSLDAPIDYSADDSGVLIIPKKQFYLYGKANTANKDIKLEAENIKYDQATNLVTAYGKSADTSSDPLKNKPKITQTGSTSISDTIKFNLKSQKGMSKNTYYNEGEIFVNAERIKKVNKDVAYAYRGRFTTCNLDTPHFDIRARKLKLINNKFAISGPAFVEFEGVPLPIPLPFGIFPLERGRHGGLLPPTFVTDQSYGIGLKNLGYYHIFSDDWDMITRADIYSYGGWRLDLNPEYYDRYHYRGNFDLSIQKTRALSLSLTPDEFTESSTFHLNWFHSLDSKARPGVTFSASVNAGSTRYNQYLPNNVFANINNNLTSTINYTKSWEQGKYNLSFLANESQNSTNHLVQLGLPTVNFSAATIYPFESKDGSGRQKWYQKLGISYTGTFINQASFYDTAVSFKRLLDTFQWGAQHRIPVTLTLPAIGPLLISPSFSYAENWSGTEVLESWDQKNNKVDSTILHGFFAARQVTTGLSFATKIYGTYNFKGGNVVAIRHVITPTIGLSYSPDLVGNLFQTVQIDSGGIKQSISKFSSVAGGSFSNTKFGGMNFGIDNSLEMKVRDKSDTSAKATKKIMLINDFSINTSYNFFADSINWSPIAMRIGSNLFNNKLNFSGSATINQYATDSFGNRINHLLWKDGKIGRFQNGSFSISTSFKSKPRDKKTDSSRLSDAGNDQTITPEQQQAELDYVRNHPQDFVDFNIPWTLQVGYALNLANIQEPDFKYNTTLTSNLTLNGDFSLTEKWKMGGQLYLDLKTLKPGAFSIFATRDMHCWQMAINLQISSYNKSFSITLNPKSGILRDLKINRTRAFTNYTQDY